MKKLIICAIALSLVVSLAGCQKKQLSDDTVSARGPVTSIGNLPHADDVSSTTGFLSSKPDDETETDTANDDAKSSDSTSSTVTLIPPKLNTSRHSNKDDVSKNESKEEQKKESSEESKTESKTTPEGTSDKVAENGTYVYEGVTIDLPKGYYIQNETDSIVTTVPGDYPYTNQNVTFTMSKGTTTHITRDEVDSMYDGMFEGFSGCKEFIEYTIDDYDAQYFSYDISMSGVKLNMAQLAIYLDNKAVIITFTSEESEDFSTLKKAVDTVRVK